MPPYGRLRPSNLSEAALDYQPRITPTGYWDRFKNQLEDNLNTLDNPFTGRGVGTDARSFVGGLLPQEGDEAADVMGIGLNPMEAPIAGIAGAIVPRALHKARIDRIVAGMKADIPKLANIPRAEKFTSNMERLMREIHPEMAAHVNKVRLYNEADVEKYMGKGTAGMYSSGYRHWTPNDVSDRAKYLDRLKDKAAAARYFEREKAYPRGMTLADEDELDRFMELDAEGFDPILNNRISIAESDEWDNPLKMFDTPLHEFGHGAQDLGFTRKYDKAVEQYKDFKNKPHLYPQQPIEIGARVTGRKAEQAARRLGLVPDDPNYAMEPARQLWAEELQSGANRSMRTLGKGSGRNTIQGIAQRTLPDINKALKFKEPIRGRILEPSHNRPPNATPLKPDWHRGNFDWGKWNRYSLLIDEPQRAMTIEEMIERGFLK